MSQFVRNLGLISENGFIEIKMIIVKFYGRQQQQQLSCPRNLSWVERRGTINIYGIGRDDAMTRAVKLSLSELELDSEQQQLCRMMSGSSTVCCWSLLSVCCLAVIQMWIRDLSHTFFHLVGQSIASSFRCRIYLFQFFIFREKRIGWELIIFRWVSKRLLFHLNFLS